MDADRDILEILYRRTKENVGTGFLEDWSSRGEFFGTITETISSLAFLQQGFSQYSQFQVMMDNPGISFGESRIVGKSGKFLDRVFEPDGDPKQFGSSYDNTIIIPLKEITNMQTSENVDQGPSVNFPPAEETEPVENSFVGDGQTKTFVMDFEYVPGTSQVVLNGAYQERGYDYTEYPTDNPTEIRMIYAPILNQPFTVKALPLTETP